MVSYERNNRIIGTIIDSCLIIPIENEATDEELSDYFEEILIIINKSEIKGAVIDLGMVTMLDSYIFYKIDEFTRTMEVMGTEVVWSRLSPGMVSSLIDLNLEIDRLNFSSNVNAGVNLINNK